MKGDVGRERQLRPVGDDEGLVIGSKGPVENAYQYLKGSSTHGQDILQVKEASRRGEIGEEAAEEGEGSDSQAYDGEVLEVPAVRLVDRSGIVGEPLVGVYEGGETKELGCGQ